MWKDINNDFYLNDSLNEVLNVNLRKTLNVSLNEVRRETNLTGHQSRWILSHAGCSLGNPGIDRQSAPYKN